MNKRPLQVGDDVIWNNRVAEIINITDTPHLDIDTGEVCECVRVGISYLNSKGSPNLRWCCVEDVEAIDQSIDMTKFVFDEKFNPRFSS